MENFVPIKDQGKCRPIYSFFFKISGRRVTKDSFTHLSSWCAMLGHLVMSNSLWPPWTVACQAPLSMGILQARILEWVVMPSSRGSSQLRNWIQVSHIADGFFIVWVTREALFEVPINPTIEASRPQGWVTSGQATYREGAQFHPWADNLIKALLSKALHTR